MNRPVETSRTLLVLIPGVLETPDMSGLAASLGAELKTGPDCRDASAVQSWYRGIAAESKPEDRWVLLGFAEGADLIARHYYQFFGARSPDAVVLLSSHASTIHLNNITCPYFAMHGEREWSQDAMLRDKVSEAIHHHQYRYGDVTEHRVALDLDRSLGGKSLDQTVLEDAVAWVRLALNSGRRPQEPMPITPARARTRRDREAIRPFRRTGRAA